MKKLFSIIILLFISVVFFINAVYLSYSSDYYVEPNKWIILYSLYDHSLTLIAVFIISLNRRQIKQSITYLQFTANTYNSYFLIILGIIIIIYYYFFLRLDMILNGYTRELLMEGLKKERFVMLFSSSIVVLFGIGLLNNIRIMYKIILFLGLIAVIGHSMSRSYLLNIVYFMITLYAFKGDLLSNKKRLLFLLLSIFVLAGIITIFQGRSSDLSSGLELAFDSLFRYQSFPFHLSEFAIENSSLGNEKVLFPFFGFMSERFFSIFFDISAPISVNGSTFISDFHHLGFYGKYSANVLYPWWSWFYGSFGWMGLFLKFLYILFIMRFLLWSKLYITFYFFISVLLFTSWMKHPLINNDSIYFFTGIIFVDLLLKYKTIYGEKFEKTTN